MKYIFLILLFLTSLHAKIDEYQVDLYFANGMNGESEKKEKRTWDKYVEKLNTSTNPAIQIPKGIKVNPKVAYNASELWVIGDAIEVIFQKTLGDATSWLKINTSLDEYYASHALLESFNSLAQAFNYEDLAIQIKSYKKSIRDGHGVVVVAHSQGNFFTNTAYSYMEDWMKIYFHMISVASPASFIAGDGPRIAYDNDPVAHISFISEYIKNINRYIWKDPSGHITGEDDKTIDRNSPDYHAFKYYMGEKVEVQDIESTRTVSSNNTLAKKVKQSSDESSKNWLS